jgi:tetrahydromethanopterin S-methyltransferase subunit H
VVHLERIRIDAASTTDAEGPPTIIDVRGRSPRSATIYVAPMIDVKDMNLAALVIDAISDTIFTAPGAPQAFERSMQLCADAMRFST